MAWVVPGSYITASQPLIHTAEVGVYQVDIKAQDLSQVGSGQSIAYQLQVLNSSGRLPSKGKEFSAKPRMAALGLTDDRQRYKQ